MQSRINTVAFNGLEILDVDLQVQIASGLPAFTIVGLPDKAVAESRERVRAALQALGLSLPAKRITINLAPADLLKEGSHFDLPVALGLLAGMGIIPQEELAGYVALGELGLDGSIIPVNGILPAEKGLICPAACGPEAVWSGLKDILAADSLLSLINHFKGQQTLPFPQAEKQMPVETPLDMSDVKGQESAKRALEIAAAGGHNLLMIGPPGAGKSMLAARLPSILPPLTAEEALETSMIHSVAGELKDGKLCFSRPYRDPHHSASTPALVGGGRKAAPGEISLAHNGVLFLDELPEFSRTALEALRQPLENGYITISRVNAHTVYPAKFQLIAAMNPCRCGWYGHPSGRCHCTKQQVEKYVEKISGPMLDRMDLHVNVPSVEFEAMRRREKAESSADVKARVNAARDIQKQRFSGTNITCNAQMTPAMVGEFCTLDAAGEKLLKGAFERLGLTARSHDRLLRVARTIADLDGSEKIEAHHLAEAIQYRNTDILQG